MKGITNDDLLTVAIEYLKAVKKTAVESVDITTTQYDDGTYGLDIRVIYPETEQDVITTSDGEELRFW